MDREAFWHEHECLYFPRCYWRDFTDHIEKENVNKGAAAIAELIADAKANEGGNYYEKYSQVNLTMPTLQSRPYADVWTLYNEELAHLETL